MEKKKQKNKKKHLYVVDGPRYEVKYNLRWVICDIYCNTL
jgi:hypothetical protein